MLTKVNLLSSLCSVIEDTPVLHLTATTSGVIPGHQGQEIDENAYMTEEFLDGVKGARYTQYGQFISGYSDTFEELVAVLDKHTQVRNGQPREVSIV